MHTHQGHGRCEWNTSADCPRRRFSQILRCRIREDALRPHHCLPKLARGRLFRDEMQQRLAQQWYRRDISITTTAHRAASLADAASRRAASLANAASRRAASLADAASRRAASPVGLLRSLAATVAAATRRADSPTDATIVTAVIRDERKRRRKPSKQLKPLVERHPWFHISGCILPIAWTTRGDKPRRRPWVLIASAYRCLRLADCHILRHICDTVIAIAVTASVSRSVGWKILQRRLWSGWRDSRRGRARPLHNPIFSSPCVCTQRTEEIFYADVVTKCVTPTRRAPASAPRRAVAAPFLGDATQRLARSRAATVARAADPCRPRASDRRRPLRRRSTRYASHAKRTVAHRLQCRL